ncbi:MAG: AAA family ATPase [Methanomassiliicoccaceae archaeon]|jgi:AAA+ ATPase superfamily predicted ATPase|nr:AAA family ATPase [Methanomassiliicoccaceae archaeon]
MKFYDREEELKLLEKDRIRSADKGSALTVITGRRRIGKTALIRESEKESKMLYVFTERVNESVLCQLFADNAKTDLGIELFNTGKFRDIFKQLMAYGENNNYTLVIDEFQELKKINKSITSIIQNLWDEYKGRTKINMIVCGSVHSMMIKMFQDGKEPLFGRASSIFNLRPFRPSVIRTILRDHDPNYKKEDLLFLYAVTGGVPKYIELLMDKGATSFEKMLDAVCDLNSIFLTDGKNLLISEFGTDYMTYFSILHMIANGKNTQKEINDVTGKECGAYLENLESKYDMIRKNRPIFSKENSRDVRWKISDNYLRFYFRFINTNMSAVELKKYDVLKEKIRSEYTEYSGKVLEDYFAEKIAEEERITNIGSHWDRKGENEIDIVALNDLDGKAIVTEVKRNPKKANIDELKRKAGTIQDLNKYDLEYRVLSLDDM